MEQNEADREQERGVETGPRAVSLIRQIGKALTERGHLSSDLTEVRNRVTWLSGEELSSRGISKDKHLEVRAWLASSKFSKEARWPELREMGQS